MVPLQLSLRNFMSYGDETTLVDFEDMQVICLSGENGHGKSALLDAITWALWGETRLGKQNHDQLVRIGADEMAVVLRFRNGGEIYRVRRQRSRKSSGNIWELQIEEPGGTWRSLTAQGTSDTGRAISNLLRMSYETFLNSAYLRQGRADEFVRQSANKRKEILGEILDLSRYDDLEDHARAKMREASDRATDEDRAINQIGAELAAAASAPDLLAAVEQQIDELHARQQELSARADTLAESRATLNVQRAKLAETESRTKDLESRKLRHLRQISEEQTTIDGTTQLLADKQRIEQDVARHEVLLKRLEQLQSNAQRFRGVEARRVQLQLSIDSTQREMKRDLDSAETDLRTLRSVVRTLPELEQKINGLESAQNQLQTLQRRQELEELQRQECKIRFGELAAEKKRCDSDVLESESRLERILDQTEVCSICGSPLPAEKLQALAEQCAGDVEAARARLIDLKRQGTITKNRIDHLDLELAARNAEIKRLLDARVEHARLQQQVLSLREQQAREPELLGRVESLRRQLSSGEFAVENRSELEALLPEHAALSGAEEELGKSQQEARSLRSSEAAYARLQHAERELSAAQARQASVRMQLADVETQIASLSAFLLEAPALDQQIAANTAERGSIQSQSNAVTGDMQRAEREHGRLQSVIQRSAMLAQQRVEREAELSSARDDRELYMMLMSSFGKQGVQALIIENALPELETDSNDLLQRLTDGQMSITLQTTRQAKTKSTGDAPIETLDIVISDALGSRSLEMYSGGESFRISFALRIALSKLLARHAGAQLQTLIIDEGFGTQDARGREKLVDSIMAVQADFAQIIVITHVEEIKDAFPNRIEVFKTPSGSEVNLVVGAALG